MPVSATLPAVAWISQNVLWQQGDEMLSSVVRSLAERKRDAPSSDAILHVLNAFATRSSRDQEVFTATLDSHLAARRFDGERVAHLAITFPDEHALASHELYDAHAIVERRGPDDGIGPGSRPALFELLEIAAEADVPGDFVVYTNIDICLQPAFYRGVRHLLACGADSLIINRRTVLEWELGDPAAGLAQFDLGEIHPGMDCFVFPRSWVERFEATGAIVGHGHVMRGLLYNLVAHAEALVVLTKAAMTYHFDDDRPWTGETARPYLDANVGEAARCFAALGGDPERARRLHAFVSAKPKYRPA